MSSLAETWGVGASEASTPYLPRRLSGLRSLPPALQLGTSAVRSGGWLVRHVGRSSAVGPCLAAQPVETGLVLVHLRPTHVRRAMSMPMEALST